MRNREIASNRRVLIIDDNPAIHEDFKKILGAAPTTAAAFDEMETALFGDRAPVMNRDAYEIDSAFQGEEGLERVRQAYDEGHPYAMAFVDIRMPPGWDGIETIARIWHHYPDIQVVICTAYSDYSWDEMVDKLCRSENLLILKKPFDNVEVRQLACALTEKWKLALQARLKLNELEHMVSARTRSIEQAYEELRAMATALAAAKEAAEAASVSKARFLANVSHEIRTPLSAVLGYADLLLDPAQSHEQRRECVEIIRRHGDNLLQIINDILDLTKVEAGRITVERVACSPVEICRDVISLMAIRAREKNLTLELEAAGPVPASIRTDPKRLRQILINLVSNAIKFTDKGGVRVRVQKVAAPDTAEPKLRFDVIDTGIGIPPDALSTLFRPFAQANHSPAHDHGGTGLGLTISKRLAEMLGGDLSVTSTPGVGSSFSATIAAGPLSGTQSIEPANLATAAASRAEPIQEPLPALHGRLLLVDDSPDNQRLLACILRTAGAEVEVADTGRMAIETSLARPFDVILMDMQMPEMDGYTATRTLRGRGYRGPIVALTAHAMNTDRAKCLEAGCDDYATKPINRPSLLRLVAKWIESCEVPVPVATAAR